MSVARPVEEHYSPRELADRLGLSSKAVCALFAPGKIWPVVKLNARVIRAPASSVNRYLDQNTWNPKPVEVAA